MSVIDFKIVTPERKVFEDKVYQVTLPVANGEVTILPNHRSYIASLKTGEIVAKKEKGEGEDVSYAVHNGFIEFNKNKLVVMVDEAERPEDISFEAIAEARKRAEELKKNRENLDEREYAKVLVDIEKGLVWTKIAEKYAYRRGRK